jgi:hypothetical protein
MEQELMTRADVLGLLTELIEEEVSREEFEKGELAIKIFMSSLNTESEDAELDSLIIDLLDSLEDKKSDLKRAEVEKIWAANLIEKEKVIEDLRSLIQDEENIGKAFNQFNDLRDSWEAIGEISQDQYSRVQTEFSRLRETFFYNIAIYKELADHDKKVNLRLKNELVEKAKAISTEKNIQTADQAIKVIIKQWDTIGGTFPKEWEVVREEFWTASRTVLDRVNGYYQEQRARLSEHLEKKKQLIQQVSDIAEKERDKRKEWNDATEKVFKIQGDWKSIGFSLENETVWRDFREACDSFFSAKQESFDKNKGVSEGRKKQKLILIEKASTFKDRDDWKSASAEIIGIQAEWKEIGATSQKDENRLWSSFRGHCDVFFNNRNAFFKERDTEEKANLKLKEQIINDLKGFKPSTNRSKDIETIRSFSETWNGIGHVPFKVKDKVYKVYHELIDGFYTSMKIEGQERSKQMFQGKMESLKDDPRALNREKDNLRSDIKKLQDDIRQYENNLGFFNAYQDDNPLKKEVERKIAKNKEKVIELRNLLKLV